MAGPGVPVAIATLSDVLCTRGMEAHQGAHISIFASADCFFFIILWKPISSTSALTLQPPPPSSSS